MSEASEKRLKIVVVGGGTAGWMSAAGIASLLGHAVDVTLVESEAIGTVGVGEATLPHLRHFNRTIGLDEAAMMAETRATVKLGIEFVDWGRKGESYIHPFGDFGQPDDGVGFHHYWGRLNEAPTAFGDYSLPVVMAREGKFAPPPENPSSHLAGFRWAYQCDATLYAPLLRRHGEDRGVTRIEGRIVSATRGADGDVATVVLEDGRTVEGDLFIDCSGFRSLLLGGELEIDFEDWTQWLPCDRAVAAACEASGPLLPYTRATARDAGWQWRIPLQHRTGNGYVYSSAHLDDADAEDALFSSLEGKPLAEPKRLRFRTGKRRALWSRNVVGVGLSGGFLEPLESTSIYLIQQGITYLVELLGRDHRAVAPRAEYNRMMDLEFERIRDFLILHYHATERDDTPFWNQMRTMEVPDSLARKMELFRRRGRVETYDHGLFLEASWLAVYLGQRVVPADVDPRASEVPQRDVARGLRGMRSAIENATRNMPSHADWIARHCPSESKAAA